MNETLQFWGVIGIWVASIGTVFAVFASLWLAYNQNRVKLNIKVERIAYEDIGGMSPHPGCWINVINYRNMPARIATIGWRIGAHKKVVFLDHLPFDEFPKILNRGENVKYFMRTHGIPAGDSFSDIKPLYVVVQTATGEQFIAKIKNDMTKELLKNIEKHYS